MFLVSLMIIFTLSVPAAYYVAIKNPDGDWTWLIIAAYAVFFAFWIAAGIAFIKKIGSDGSERKG